MLDQNTRAVAPEAAAQTCLMRLVRDRQAQGLPCAAPDFFPVRLEEIVRLCGWTLEVVDYLEAVGEARTEQLGRCVPADKKIYLASDSAANPGERRFTLAHEIGHAVLDHPASRCGGAIGTLRVRSARQPRSGEVFWTEQDADAFATELLMPPKAVRKFFQEVFGRDRLWVGSSVVSALNRATSGSERPYDVAHLLARHATDGALSLCEFFGVSAVAMSRRLLELRLVHA